MMSQPQALQETAFRFLRAVKMNSVPFSSPSDIDAALANELSDRCYVMNEPLGGGKYLFYGMLHLCPELSDELPRSR